MYKVILFDLDGQNPERVSRNLFSMHWRELESLNRTLRN